MSIPFNKPFLSGDEFNFIRDAIESGQISGNGKYTKLCQNFFNEQYGFKHSLLTTSCTDALEMSAILLNIQAGDEVIIPAYTFVSTANAFALRGAKLVFADSSDLHPNLDVQSLEPLINERTKAIVPVHYAGTSVDMKGLMALANTYNLSIIEDAAQAIDNYNDQFEERKALGSFGSLAAFSFHETKNIISGEGGLLAINVNNLKSRAEIIWEKGTNRSAFFRGEINKYGWVDLGSSFLPSEIISAFLYAQLNQIKKIQEKRQAIWSLYDTLLRPELEQFGIQLPYIPAYSGNNAHIYYLVCKNLAQRELIIQALKDKGIHAVFHYQSLHRSPYFKNKHDGRTLPNSDRFSDTLLRLPLYYELESHQIIWICHIIIKTLHGKS